MYTITIKSNGKLITTNSFGIDLNHLGKKEKKELLNELLESHSIADAKTLYNSLMDDDDRFGWMYDQLHKDGWISVGMHNTRGTDLELCETMERFDTSSMPENQKKEILSALKAIASKYNLE